MNGVANGLYGGDLPNKINTPWIDFSEQSTIVGWSSFTTKIIRYKVVGKMVFVYVSLDGVSNSATTSFTLPFPPFQSSFTSSVSVQINSGISVLGFVIGSSSTNVFSGRYASTYYNITGTYTASGNKVIINQFFYEI